MPRQKLKVTKVGIVVKQRNARASEKAEEVAEYLLLRKIKVVFSQDNRSSVSKLTKRLPKSVLKTAGTLKSAPKEKVVTESDLVIVFGGDGTYLSAARLMKQKSVPLMGVNMGHLGFLTEIKKDEVIETLDRILSEESVQYSERSLLEVTLKRNGKALRTGFVVNDAVISKGAIARILDLDIYVDKNHMGSFRADGIIVSTPTGSTAYSLAAGGPIVSPVVPALVITPICPHSLTHRPIVVSSERELQVRISESPGSVILTLDGQDMIEMKNGDTVCIRRYKRHFLKLVYSPSRDYYTLLREKFKFAEGTNMEEQV